MTDKQTKETIKWLETQKREVKNDSKAALISLLENTTDIISQLLKNPNSKLYIGLAESCVKHNNILIRDLLN